MHLFYNFYQEVESVPISSQWGRFWGGGGGPIMNAMRVSARRHEIVRVNNEFLLRPNFLQKAEKEVSYSLFSLLYSIP